MNRVFVAAATLALGVACAAPARDDGGPRIAIARACAGLSDTEVANAMGNLKGNVEAVESKYEAVTYPKGSPPQRLAGAVIHVRATPGTTVPWLTRVLTCHALRHAPDVCAAKDRCPLAADGAQVAVSTTATGFAVAIEAKDSAVAAEILRRSRELAQSP